MDKPVRPTPHQAMEINHCLYDAIKGQSAVAISKKTRVPIQKVFLHLRCLRRHGLATLHAQWWDLTREGQKCYLHIMVGHGDDGGGTP